MTIALGVIYVFCVGVKMRVYLFVAIFIAICFSYVFGVRYGAMRAGRECTNAQQVNQSNMIKLQGVVNAEVLGHGVGDIRDILRKKYTIAE